MFHIEKSRKGTELHPDDQRYVLAAYVHRFTKAHRPQWAAKRRSNGKPYKPHFASDRDWLEHTRFQVTKDGRLDQRVNECQSTPTWPDGQECVS